MNSSTKLNLGSEKKEVLRVEGLKVSFATRSGFIYAIDDVSFSIKEGETFGLVGESGCGKSQTAISIMRLTPLSGLIEHGDIWFDNINLTKDAQKEYEIKKKGNRTKIARNDRAIKAREERLRDIRGKEIAMVFQEPMTSLNPVLTIGKQISEALLANSKDELAARIIERHSGFDKKSKGDATEPIENSSTSVGIGKKALIFLKETKKHAGKIPRKYRMLSRLPLIRRYFLGLLEREAMIKSLELMTLVNMPNAEKALYQYPHELSGGMRQRAMIAMAISTNPKLLIADEPTSALDVTVQAQILSLLKDLKKTLSMTILFISHDMGVIADVCDRVGVMYAGNLVEVSTTEELYANPKHPYTQGLLRAIPWNTQDGRDLQPIRGSVPDLSFRIQGCRFYSRCKYAMDVCRNDPPLVEVAPNHQVLCWLYSKNKGSYLPFQKE